MAISVGDNKSCQKRSKGALALDARYLSGERGAEGEQVTVTNLAKWKSL